MTDHLLTSLGLNPVHQTRTGAPSGPQGALLRLRAWGASLLRVLAARLEVPPSGVVTMRAFIAGARGSTGWWREVLLRDPCVYCGGRTAELDHIMPRSRRGPDHWTNRAPACTRCNRAKGAQTLLHFLLRQPRHWRQSGWLPKTATTTRASRKAAWAAVTTFEAAMQAQGVAEPKWKQDVRRKAFRINDNVEAHLARQTPSVVVSDAPRETDLDLRRKR